MTARTRFDANTGLALALAASLLFTGAIWYFGDRLTVFSIGPDRPGMWYEWQLAEPSFLSRASAWTGYVLHQLTIWFLIYKAQHSNLSYTRELKPINLIAMAATAGFIVLHFAQSHVWYDGLAQDVPEWTSQWSVILLLLAVILLENRRRGIAFGKPWGGVVRDAGGIVRKYHGYYFAWATVYTFWYHPMLATPGHLFGFIYMFMLFTQSCLFFTRAHLNRYWTIALEVMVLFHGVTVALMQGSEMWTMFGFGLAGIFVVTQAFGLGLSRRTAWTLVAAWVASVVAFYSWFGWDALPAMLRIFAGYYIALPILAGLLVLIARMTTQRRPETSSR